MWHREPEWTDPSGEEDVIIRRNCNRSISSSAKAEYKRKGGAKLKSSATDEPIAALGRVGEGRRSNTEETRIQDALSETEQPEMA
jgi:hypothetical protein